MCECDTALTDSQPTQVPELEIFRGATLQRLLPLPAPLTPRVGREAEIATSLKIFRQTGTRLLTFTGPGGVGKTRLALEVAHALQADDRVEVAFVDLSVTNDPDMLLPLIAQSLRMTVGNIETLQSRLLRALGDRKILLLLDGFERVAHAATEIVNLLESSPNANVLVTSRMPLRVRGEHEFAVPPMILPKDISVEKYDLDKLMEVDAIRLFMHRAQAVRPNFQLTQQNARDVIEICRRLDGLPLAIELAAVRIKLFPVRALRDRLTDRLSFLTGGPRDLPTRLQTMRHAIQWSFDLLDPHEQELFRKVSVFSGSFSYQAASHVTQWPERTSAGVAHDLYDDLHSLFDKSLIVADTSDDDDLHFRMMEIVQEFGLERAVQAGELQTLKRRHLEYYAMRATVIDGALIGPDQAQWLQRIDNDLGNIRLALRNSLELGGEAHNDGLIIAMSLWRYWLIRGQFSEGAMWLRSLLDVPSTLDTTQRARALNNLANLEFELGSHEKARQGYRESKSLYQLAGDQSGVADELNNLGMLYLHDGDLDAASAALNEALEIRERIIDLSAMPPILSNLGDIAMYRGDLDLAEQYHLKAYRIRTELGNVRGIALSCYNLGIVNLLRPDREQAESWFETGWTYAREIQDTFLHACLWLGEGVLRSAQRQLNDALNLLAQALTFFREMSSRRMVVDTLDAIAYALTKVGLYQEAGELIGSSHGIRRHYAVGAMSRSGDSMVIISERVRTALGDGPFQLAIDRGTRRSYEEAIDSAFQALERAKEALHTAPPADGSDPETENSYTKDEQETFKLTKREVEVLQLLARGLSDKDIADSLSISPRTAMTHVSNILTKLKVNRRSAATSVGIQAGLIEDPDANGKND